MRFTEHLTSILSWVFITVNLLIWLPLLLIAALSRMLLPFESVTNFSNKLVDQAYRSAVRLDGWWLQQVLGIRFLVEDNNDVIRNLSSADSPLIISNHRSWFDIFVLQTLISSHGPILTFLIKTELLFVPVLGWICIALNFPRLNRNGDRKSRQKDLQVARSASMQLSETPGALLLFPEGTRFTERKRSLNASPYSHLLRPKHGGFKAIHCALPRETMILDISISYPDGGSHCWRCMGGLLDEVRIKVTAMNSSEVDNSANWLAERWRQKDLWLNQKKEVETM